MGESGQPPGRGGTDPVLDSSLVGAWRSLVAHQSGGLVVVGSNPAAPTNPSLGSWLAERVAEACCANGHGTSRAAACETRRY